MKQQQHDLDLRKSIHIKLLSDTHAGLKIQSCRLKLSMQAIMDELAALVVDGDLYIMRKLEDAARRKRDKETKALYDTDAESLLDIIEDERRREKQS